MSDNLDDIDIKRLGDLHQAGDYDIAQGHRKVRRQDRTAACEVIPAGLAQIDDRRPVVLPFPALVRALELGRGDPFLDQGDDLIRRQLRPALGGAGLVDGSGECHSSRDLVGIDSVLQQPLHFGKGVALFLERYERDALAPQLGNNIVALDKFSPELVDLALRCRTCRLRQELCEAWISLDGLNDRFIGGGSSLDLLEAQHGIEQFGGVIRGSNPHGDERAEDGRGQALGGGHTRHDPLRIGGSLWPNGSRHQSIVPRLGARRDARRSSATPDILSLAAAKDRTLASTAGRSCRRSSLCVAASTPYLTRRSVNVRIVASVFSSVALKTSA